jgi:hypothetical protein
MMKYTFSRKRKIAWLLLLVMTAQLFTPYQASALTGGPSQPEVQSFEPIGTSDMVDVSTGSFTYNIPLLEVGGYPLNLAYHSGATPDDEASVCGLGWNINPGVINRNMRGLPDDFDGEQVTKEFNMKPNKTWGGSQGIKFELFGLSKKAGAKKIFNLSANYGIFYNNYKGVGFEFGILPGFTAGDKASMTVGLGLTANSQSGVTISPSINFSAKFKFYNKGDQGNIKGGLSIGAPVNSRLGLSALSMGTSLGISTSSTTYLGTDENGNAVSKMGKGKASMYGGSSSFNFAAPNYSPQMTLPFRNFSFSGTFSLGSEIVGAHPGGSITGYFSQQKLDKNTSSSSAYGFLYAHHAVGDENALMDFNREKDGSFTENTPNLSLPVFTNDIYGATGQGIAGSYQLKRGDIGVLADPKVLTKGSGGNLSVEVGLGAPPGIHIGGDIVVNKTDSRSNSWMDDNNAFTTLTFAPPSINDPRYEPAYFKIAGEKSVETDLSFFNDNGGVKPVRVQLEGGEKSNMDVKANNAWEGLTTTPNPHRKSRERRNQSISYLTADEASNFGLEKQINSHPINVFSGASIQHIGRTSEDRKPKHLSEITLLRQDGLRYFYSIPVYNLKQKEVSFSTDNIGNCNTGLVAIGNSEDTPDNHSGNENYYNKITLPKYAHSYLLTAIVSQDYVDLTGNGPSPDDYGTYTKFNYTRLTFNNTPSDFAYEWRIPYQNGQANFNEGFKSNYSDNKGNYIAGEKEYWVLHSVESKNQVAEFTYDNSNRKDALSSDGERLPKLEKITLYSFPDRRPNMGFNTQAIPIKTVWFEYNYSLCPNVPNNFNIINNVNSNSTGKLTLSRLWFTNGNSQKGKLSPYVFKYEGANSPTTFEYGLKNYNRWGSYQKNDGSGTDCYLHPENSTLNTSDYPYVPQNPAEADKNAYAYNLTQIKLPSGGAIRVEYEANRYAFTQDRRAMEMTEVIGAGSSVDANAVSNSTNNLCSGTGNATPNNYLYFKLRKSLPQNRYSSTTAKQEVWREYFQGAFGEKSIDMGFMYFKFLVNVGTPGTPAYEYVPGYVRIKNYGVIPASGSADYQYGFVELDPVTSDDTGNKDANPIAKTSWQFARLYLPKVAYGESNVNESGGDEQIIRALASMGKQMVQFIDGFNDFMRKNDYGKKFVIGKSWLRLYSPQKNKIAGGSRVKSVRVSDNWSKMDPGIGTDSEYGQNYDYTTFEVLNGDTLHYSSGVAAYEPMVGGDENPFRQPVYFKEKALLAPDDQFVQEEPFGESFFPAPQIIYSRVTVRNLSHTNVERTATGYLVHEFYTAKDFPTKTSNTGVKAIPKKTNPIFKQLKLKHKDYMTASQGFAIELNDMHGKPKAQWVYDQGGTQLSGIEYRYKRNGDRLDNEDIKVVDPCGRIKTANVGLESSLVSDSRETYTKTWTAGVQANSDDFLAGLFPVLTVIPLPSFHQEQTRFRSMVTTKVIQHYGLLERTIAHDLGASVSTDNVAWDAETGEVIMTKTTNEFHDPIYNTNIPAHWGYEGMRGAYQNIGAEFSGISTINGVFTSPWQAFFTPGDEIAVNDIRKIWVKDVNHTNGKVYLIDANGQPADLLQSDKIKIIRSGRRNQQLNSIGSVTTTKMPVSGSMLDFTDTGVLNASTVEYSDRWQTWCQDKSCVCQPHTGLINDFKALLNFIKNNKPFGNNLLYPNLYSLPLATFLNSLGPNSELYQTLNIPGCTINQETVTSNFNPLTGDWSLTFMPCPCTVSIKIPLNDIPLPFRNNIESALISIQSISPNLSICDSKKFLLGLNMSFHPGPSLQLNVESGSTCFPFFGPCSMATNCGYAIEDVVNPYRTNNRGVFRPLRNWAYLTDRKQTDPANIRTDGAFKTFSMFWNKPLCPSIPNPSYPDPIPEWGTTPANWTWASEVTRYNPVGNELENRDALNRFSAELTGYANTQVVATASNARYRQIAFDGFEDYSYSLVPNTCQSLRHFGFEPNLVDDDASHSGKYSLKLASNANTEAEYIIKLPNCPTPLANKTANTPFVLNDCDCVGRFSPDPGKYVFSAWVREDRPATTLNFDQSNVEITSGGLTATFIAAGPIIEGWQRIYGEFDVPVWATDIVVKLNAAPTVISRFDDLRIHPFDANFKSYVYDDLSLRFTYELDENNFFTKYEYDPLSGTLERIKKETERGVMTIQESRFGQQKNQNQ